MRQVAVFAVVVESVAYDEDVGDSKTVIVGFYLDLAPPGLPQQHG